MEFSWSNAVSPCKDVELAGLAGISSRQSTTYVCISSQGPAVAWAATLGVALYSRMGAEWYAAAYGVVAVWKLFRGYQKDSKV